MSIAILARTNVYMQVKEFKNGVKLVLVPISGVESLSVGVFVGCGSRYEEARFSGISHFLEHMVFKGTKKFPSYKEVHQIEEMGGLQNAYTSNDLTKYYAKVLSPDWEQALEVVSDLVLAPLLPEKEFESERKVIFEEMAMYEDDLPDKADELLGELFYGDNGLGRRVIGTKESLLAVDRESMQRYRDQMYTANDLVVVLAGKITDVSQIEARVGSLFDLPKVKNVGFETFLADAGKERKIKAFVKKEANQANLAMGFRVCGRHDEDRFALQVFNLLFGVGFTSRLFRSIREEKGLCYSIGSSVSLYHEVGDWSISAGLNAEKLDQAITAIGEELKRVIHTGVSNEELEIAKKRVEAALAFRMESPDNLGEYFGRQMIYGQELLSVEQLLQKINAVEISDIERILSKYFDFANLKLSVVGKVDFSEEKLETMVSQIG